jgi:hypothetical protein
MLQGFRVPNVVEGLFQVILGCAWKKLVTQNSSIINTHTLSCKCEFKVCAMKHPAVREINTSSCQLVKPLVS